MLLNLGSGSRPMDGWVNVDVVALPEVDVVHDLDVVPWPWKDGAAEAVAAEDVFEHVGNPVAFMTEAHRVLQVGGGLIIKSPHWQSQDAFTDPTHRRFCTPYTWDYWIEGTTLFERHNAAYGGVAFTLAGRQQVESSIFINLVKI